MTDLNDKIKSNSNQLLISNIFRTSNRLQIVLDKTIQDISGKQWLVLNSLDYFDSPPSLNEIAEICDFSHQNTKKIIDKLAEKGFVSIHRDLNDRRVLRIVKLRKADKWHKETGCHKNQFINSMLSDLSEEEIKTLTASLEKIRRRLNFIIENNSED